MPASADADGWHAIRKVLKEPSPMTRTPLALALIASLGVSVGCTSKKYVRQQTTPIIEKTNELDDLTAKNTNSIRDVDKRAQAGIEDVNQRASAADQKAQAAGQQAS